MSAALSRGQLLLLTLSSIEFYKLLRCLVSTVQYLQVFHNKRLAKGQNDLRLRRFSLKSSSLPYFS